MSHRTGHTLKSQKGNAEMPLHYPRLNHHRRTPGNLGTGGTRVSHSPQLASRHALHSPFCSFQRRSLSGREARSCHEWAIGRAAWVAVRWGGFNITSLSTEGWRRSSPNAFLCIRRWSSPEGACGSGEVTSSPHPQPPEIPLSRFSKKVNGSVVLGSKHDPFWYHVLWQSLMIPPVTTPGTFCHWFFKKEAETVSSPPPSPSSWIRDGALSSKVVKAESTFLKAWPRLLLALEVKTDPLTPI